MPDTPLQAIVLVVAAMPFVYYLLAVYSARRYARVRGSSAE
jgi:hypothetical protein